MRYAADAIIGFEHEHEARQYLQDLRERLAVYELELNRDKTRPIRFGRFARLNREERGEGKPESFTFPDFQHLCAENSLGRFEVRRVTAGGGTNRSPGPGNGCEAYSAAITNTTRFPAIFRY